MNFFTCDSRELFAGLEIAKDPSFEQHLNQYEDIVQVEGIERTFKLVNMELYSMETGLSIQVDMAKAEASHFPTECVD